MTRFADAAVSVERYTECLRDGVEELYDAPVEDWVGARWRGRAQEDSNDNDLEDDCMSDAKAMPATDADILEQLGHEQTRPHPLPAPVRTRGEGAGCSGMGTGPRRRICDVGQVLENPNRLGWPFAGRRRGQSPWPQLSGPPRSRRTR
eukprot:1128549-Pyramimonas_sp.AAC.1